MAPTTILTTRIMGASAKKTPALVDRLYAELCMVVAHARELERRVTAHIH